MRRPSLVVIAFYRAFDSGSSLFIFGAGGYIVLKASAPVRYYIYYLLDRGYTPIGGGVLLIVNP